MTIELKVNLTNEEKEILSKAREITNDLGDAIRDIADNVTGVEKDVITDICDKATLCDAAWVKLGDLCDEFGID